MEDAVSALEREFKRINIDLDYTSRRLEADFKTKGEDFSAVVSLVQRIDALRSQLSVVSEKVFSCCEKRQSLVLRVAKQQLNIFSQLSELLAQYQIMPKQNEATTIQQQDDQGSMIGSSNSDWQIAQQALATTVDQYCSLSAPEKLGEIRMSSTNDVHLQRAHQKDETINRKESEVPQTCRSYNDTSKISSQSGVMIEIDEEDFLAVPAHIRGRCVLQDTNNLLRLLLDDHQQHILSKQKSKSTNKKSTNKRISQKSTLWTISALESNGHRVSGQTGKCMLGVLQRLGFVHWVRGGPQTGGETVSLSTSLCKELETTGYAQ